VAVLFASKDLCGDGGAIDHPTRSDVRAELLDDSVANGRRFIELVHHAVGRQRGYIHLRQQREGCGLTRP
jgi:hypothetical protein